MADEDADGLPQDDGAQHGNEERVTQPEARHAAKRTSSWWMRNWRLRTKLTVVIIVPVLTALVLGGLRAQVDVVDALSLYRTVDQVRVARTATDVVHELQRERTLAVAWVASGKKAPSTELDTQMEATDKLGEKLKADVNELSTDEPTTRARYEQGLQRLSVLSTVRRTTVTTKYPDVAVYAAYSSIIDAVFGLGREVGFTLRDRGLLADSAVIQALAQQKEYIAQQNAILQIAAVHEEFPADLLTRLRDAEAGATSALQTYRANASAEQLQLYSDTVSGPEVDNRQRIMTRAMVAASAVGVDEESGRDETETVPEEQPPPEKPSLSIDRGELSATGASTLNHLHAVEGRLLADMRSGAEGLAAAAVRSALQDGLYVLLAVVVAVLVMVFVTRSLLRAIRKLRQEALDVADRRLPATVRRILDDPEPSVAAKRAVEPIAVLTREETGQVARAFDAVQEQAVHMAVEQAVLRDNINSILANLSRRSQSLVERQLSLIDRLELDESDPDQLASLFELDHLATRMRRYSESLLVLSGAGLTRQFNKPVTAAEVVGAAVSEVEQYARVDVAEAPEVAVQGRVVSDLVHLIAELLDNATFFSEPTRKVRVRMAITRKRELGIQVTDNGVGMSEQDLAAANQRLAEPPELDVTATRRMGLYVVSSLAKRHGIEVRLRDNEDIDGGLIARVLVPAHLIERPGGVPAARPAEETVAEQRRAPVPELVLAGNAGLTVVPEGDRAPRASGGDHAAPDPAVTPDALPIYEAVLSRWFREDETHARHAAGQHRAAGGGRPDDDDSSATEAADAQSAPDAQTAPDVQAAPDVQTGTDWLSPADEGWRSAQVVEEASATAATTAAGLPKRVPKAYLVPGSVCAPATVPDAVQTSTLAGEMNRTESLPGPVRTAEAVRTRMSSLQEGVRRGRNELGEVDAADASSPEENRQDEEQQ